MANVKPMLVGIDIGTTNLKLVAVHPGGRIEAVVRRAMVVDRPSAGAAEFNVAALERNLVEGLAELASRLGERRAAVEAIGVASIGESFVGLSGEGEVLTPCPTWYDRRTVAGRPALGLDAKGWFDITGMVDDDIYTVHRLAWWGKHAPETVARVRRWMMVADYAVYLLSGAFVASPSLAARSGMADRSSTTWSRDILSSAGLDDALLPELKPSASIAGVLTDTISRLTGLRAGIPIINAGHDHPCAGLGCGLADPGEVIDSTGTSEALKTVLSAPLAYEQAGNGAYDCYPHVVPDRFLLSGHTPASGGFIDWLVRRLSGPDATAETVNALWALAREAQPGSGGVRMTPFLEGTGAPWNDRARRASFSGIGAEAGSGEMLRAGVESLGAWLVLNLELFTSLAKVSPQQLFVTGGGARNTLANDIKAAMTGLPLTMPEVEEAAGLGAALVAGLAIGLYSSAAEAASTPDTQRTTIAPDLALQAAYSELLPDIKAVIAGVAR